MFRIITFTLLSIAFLACGSGNKIYRTTEDKTLLKTIKALDKNPDNAQLRADLNDLYKQAAQSHLDLIDLYNRQTDLSRWDNILKEYQSLRSLSETVNASATAQQILKVPLYVSELETSKQNAAAAYYDYAVQEMNRDSREDYKEAWYAFRKADAYIPGFKDARAQMAIAFQKGTVNVVINPVRDNSYYYNNLGSNRYGNSFNNDNFQRNLVRDLGGAYNRTLPAMFYTDWEAITKNIRPDWQVDLTWENLDVPRPYSKNYSRSLSKQVEIGKDTSGKSIYQTVYATLSITKKYFTATGDIMLQITDANTRQSLLSQRYSDTYNWQQEGATYSGDSRALDTNDWTLVNTRSWQMPRSEEILEQLYNKLYPTVKNAIYNAVRW
jgi:hypothetical protein